ncbi:MAG: hypothetical protein A4E62_00001 [Syntrophorhabdus sp. PtaU1.Bin002]|nr:MAG: hypothetical protein A4E62_00001 [Syntrophorhabdus sp. PtaU1.Bin002]
MDPVLGRKVIEGKENIFVFHKAVTSFLELCSIEGKEDIIGHQGLFSGGGHAHVVDLFLGLRLTLFGILSKMFIVL